jgi:RNA methyltransferase, TrmH family
VKLLTLARDLRRRKARERQGLFVAEGIRAVEELLDAGLVVRGVLVAPHLDATPRGATLHTALLDRAVPLVEVSDAELASAADTDTPQGVLVVAEQPRHTLDTLVSAAGVPPGGELRLLALDALQDPGNAGTLLRTAAALGVAATIALPGTVDLWSAKVVRSAMGAHFRHPSLSCTWDTFAAFLDRRAVPLWAADGAGEPLDAAAATVRSGSPLAVVVGNEGGGLTAAARESASRLVSIPIADAVESLNAAVAGAIILYAVRPGSLRR